MVCGKCSGPIDSKTEHWVFYRKNKNYDWAYHSFHRGCYHDQTGWLRLEKEAAKKASKYAAILRDFAALLEKHGTTFAEIRELLGEDD